MRFKMKKKVLSNWLNSLMSADLLSFNVRNMVPDPFYAPGHRTCGAREMISRLPRKEK
jgi:hypothetical protein